MGPKPRLIGDDALCAAVLDIRYKGYAVIENFCSEELTALMLDLVESDYQPAPIVRRNLSPNQALDKYIYHLQFKNKKYLDLLTESNILQILIPFLNDSYYRQIPDNLPNFLLGYYNARSSVAALPLHQDNLLVYRGGTPISMQIAISLSGQNHSNGATILVPGSHMSGSLADREYNNAEILDLNPGDAAIWDSRLWHGALENTSGMDRWSLIGTFRPWWAKQNFDPVRGLSEHLFAAMDNQQKALLGFLSLPVVDDLESVSIKLGYDDLLGSIREYRERRSNEG
jgi:hypothetical protein